jgi:hypothetical protein
VLRPAKTASYWHRGRLAAQNPRGMIKLHKCMFVLSMCCVLAAACGYVRKAEERTDDGLVRVPSRASGGVYRAPGASFTQYHRIILEPPTIEFTPEWRKNHPEVTDVDVTRIRNEAIKLFRDEFTRELVDRGAYEYADAPAPDVLLVAPRVVDLDIAAPDAGNEVATRSYTPGPVKMQLAGDLRDAASGALVARVITFEGQSRYGFNELRLANRASNAHEMRLGFAKWSKLVHEALNVAKATRPE